MKEKDTYEQMMEHQTSGITDDTYFFIEWADVIEPPESNTPHFIHKTVSQEALMKKDAEYMTEHRETMDLAKIVRERKKA